MIVPDVKPTLNPYLAMTSEKYLKEVTVGPVSALSGKVVLEEYDAAWKGIFEEEKEKIGRALGRNGIVTEHVGSTSVPGLCAKPVIDILLIVRDSSDENAYVPQLERVGYTMRIREPEWFRHRMLKKHNPEVNLHVFSYGCSEAKRMLDFRDWLRTDEGDRMLYGNTKKALVQREWHYLQDYADAKSDVVREIFSHMECRTPQEKDACEIMPCVIRPWRTEDAEDIAYAMNNRNVLDNLRDGIPFPYTPSDALEYMSFLAKSGQGQIYSFVIDYNGRAVGSISATRQQDIHSRTAEAGYYIAEEFWGLGIGTSALRQLRRYIFSHTDIIRLFAMPFDDNAASCRILENCGFSLEGILRCNAVKNGTVRDMRMYAALSSV